jgi:glycosyltransferase involved in cell wall biosynthesis
MKIAFDHQVFNSQSYGGISRYYNVLAQELLKKGQDVGVFSGIHCNEYLASLPAGVDRGLKLNKYPLKSGHVFQMFNHYLANMQINKWQPDIVHETYYSPLPLLRTKAPRVTTVYDMIHEIYPQMSSVLDITTYRKRKTFERVEHIISISHNTKSDLIKMFGIKESKISVVHLGVDLSFFKHLPIQNTILQRPILLYVGARGGYKNFQALLKAVARSDQLKGEFDIVAFGGGVFNRKELTLMSSLGFSEQNVRQVGGSDEKLREFYHLASAFIYPSLYEGFGIPPLEAMACSCPVISSNTSSMPEVIGNAGEYFDPVNTDELVAAIENVVYSSTRSQELMLLGRERVKLFSWEVTANKTFDVYQKVVG